MPNDEFLPHSSKQNIFNKCIHSHIIVIYFHVPFTVSMPSLGDEALSKGWFRVTVSEKTLPFHISLYFNPNYCVALSKSNWEK